MNNNKKLNVKMAEWGYTINKDWQIDFDRSDKRIAKFVLKNEPTFNLCMACGTCTATCSAGNLTDFNIRKLNILFKRGEVNDLEEEMEKCMFCGKCQLACPRGVKTRNVIFYIKRGMKNVKNEL